MWAILALLSAFFLGIYDLMKKKSLHNNPVIPVLFYATLSGAIIFLPFVIISIFFPYLLNETIFFVEQVSLKAHLLFVIKSIIVASSWILAYYAVKNLPLTIVSPIRASAPVWVLLGGLIFFGERLTLVQWIGILFTFVFYYLFSLVGKKEGIHFKTNKWVLYISLATIIGSISSLYDKYLTIHYPRMSIQAFYMIYMVFLFIPILIYDRKKDKTPIHFTIFIPLIGAVLSVADFVYFYALSIPDSLVSVVSILRRGSVIISFALGAYFFAEKNLKNKALALLGIVTGIVIIILGS